MAQRRAEELRGGLMAAAAPHREQAGEDKIKMLRRKGPWEPVLAI